MSQGIHLVRNRNIYFLVGKIGTGESTFAHGKSSANTPEHVERSFAIEKRWVNTLLFLLEKRPRLDSKHSILMT